MRHVSRFDKCLRCLERSVPNILQTGSPGNDNLVKPDRTIPAEILEC
jgi:hypothetical protein